MVVTHSSNRTETDSYRNQPILKVSLPEVAELKFRAKSLSSINFAHLYCGHDKTKQTQKPVLLCG